MSNLPIGSDIFRTVLGEMDNKYLNIVNNGNEVVNFKPMQLANSINNNNVYKVVDDRKGKNRVQWIDECKKVPIASERRHCFIRSSTKESKPILKYKANCLIVVSDWETYHIAVVHSSDVIFPGSLSGDRCQCHVSVIKYTLIVSAKEIIVW